MDQPIRNLIAIDYGTKRVGLAVTNTVSKLPSPVTALANDDSLQAKLQATLKDRDVSVVVVGLPRGLDGQDTQQTLAVRQFATDLEQQVGHQVYLQDEALTSVQAEAELKQRGQQWAKADVDSLAAVYILQDFLDSSEGKSL